jgi:hypothetical protein
MLGWAIDGVDDGAKRAARVAGTESKEDASPLALALPRVTQPIAENMVALLSGLVRTAKDAWPANRARVSYMMDAARSEAGTNELVIKVPMRAYFETYARGQGLRMLSMPPSSQKLVLFSSRVVVPAQPYFEVLVESLVGAVGIGARARTARRSVRHTEL